MPINFTVNYDDRVNDADDTSGDVAAAVVTGPMYFIPSVLPGYRIPDLHSLTRPTGLAVRAFAGYLDTDGRLRTRQGGDVGVRLWANDPDWELPRLQYQVRAELTDQLGRPVPWAAFYFDAPGADVEINLVDYMPKPGQKFGRGPGAPRIRSGSFNDDGDLVLENADGTTIDPITLPSVAVALVDNGDGTWSVG